MSQRKEMGRRKGVTKAGQSHIFSIFQIFHIFWVGRESRIKNRGSGQWQVPVFPKPVKTGLTGRLPLAKFNPM